MKVLKEKLRAAKAELRIRVREVNAAARGWQRAYKLVHKLEAQIERKLARTQPRTK